MALAVKQGVQPPVIKSPLLPGHEALHRTETEG
jgi:hypothetical protein